MPRKPAVVFSISPFLLRPTALYLPSSPLHRRCTTPTSLRLCVQKNTCVPKACVEIPTTTHVFLTRMARNFRNCHPAHLDTTDHRVAMGGCHGNLPSFSLFLPFSSGRRPSTYHPLLCIADAQLPPLCASACKKNTCVPKACVEIPTTSHVFFNTDGTEFSELPSGTF